MRHILDFIESLDKEGAHPDLYMASEESIKPRGNRTRRVSVALSLQRNPDREVSLMEINDLTTVEFYLKLITPQAEFARFPQFVAI